MGKTDRVAARMERIRPRKKGRIDWSEADRQSLAGEAFELLQKYPHKNLIWLINAAQDKLGFSADHKRNITAFTQVDWLKRAFKDKFLQLNHELYLLRNKKDPLPPPPPPKPKTPEEIIGDASIEQLFGIMLPKLIKRLNTPALMAIADLNKRLDNIEVTVMGAILNRDSVVKKAEKKQEQTAKQNQKELAKKLPTIAVVGVNRNQQLEIQRKFSNKARFKFKDGKGAHVAMPTADHVFVVAAWSSRQWVDTAKKYNNATIHQTRSMLELLNKISNKL